jgi:hypothetical protein
VSSVVISHGTPATVFVAASSGAQHGIFRSTDGGDHWAPSGTGLSTNAIYYGLRQTPGGSLYVIAYDQGLFKSADGGDHWTSAIAGLSEEDARNIRTIAPDPRNGSVLYLASGFKLFRSRDGGESWSPVPMPDFLVNELVFDPFRSEILYACGYGTLGGEPIQVLKTSDAGATWISSDAGLPDSYVESLAIESDGPGVLYCSFGQSLPGVYRSTDSGAHWERLAFDFGGRAILSVRTDPYEIGMVYAVGFGGSPSGPAPRHPARDARARTVARGPLQAAAAREARRGREIRHRMAGGVSRRKPDETDLAVPQSSGPTPTGSSRLSERSSRRHGATEPSSLAGQPSSQRHRPS